MMITYRPHNHPVTKLKTVMPNINSSIYILSHLSVYLCWKNKTVKIMCCVFTVTICYHNVNIITFEVTSHSLVVPQSWISSSELLHSSHILTFLTSGDLNCFLHFRHSTYPDSMAGNPKYSRTSATLMAS